MLEATVAGDAPARKDLLADAILEQPLVRAALEVKAGSELATVRAGSERRVGGSDNASSAKSAPRGR